MNSVDDLWIYMREQDKQLDRIVATKGLTFGQPIQQSLENIITELDIDESGTFIDLGSGTGAILFHLSILYPQMKLIGIELSDTLYNESIRRRDTLNMHNIDIRNGDIMDLTVDDLTSEGPLYVYSFDTLYPITLVKHIQTLVSEYPGLITWLTTFFTYGLRSISDKSLETSELFSKLVIGQPPEPGVLDHSLNINGLPIILDPNVHIDFYTGDQSANYTEDMWLIYEEEHTMSLNQIRALQSHNIHPLEYFIVYTYTSKLGVKRCKLCNASAYGICKRCNVVIYCSKICQKKDYNKHKKVCF